MSKTNLSITRLGIARRVLVCAIVGTALTACASAGTSSASGSTQTRTSRDVITSEELANAHADNLYDAIQKLRPEYLRSDQAGIYGSPPPSAGSNDPGAGTTGGNGVAMVTDAVVPIMVYQDNVRLSGVDDLRHIMLVNVKEVHYLKGPQAAIRFGTNNSAGAILITSK